MTGMRSFFFAFLFSAVCAFATDFTEHCNIAGSFPGIPEGQCTSMGYVKNLIFAAPVVVSDTTTSSTSFYLYDDQNNPLTTSLINGSVNHCFYYIEANKGSDALGVNVAATFLLSAYEYGTLVSIIYRRDAENGNTFLTSIALISQP